MLLLLLVGLQAHRTLVLLFAIYYLNGDLDGLERFSGEVRGASRITSNLLILLIFPNQVQTIAE
jgi:hypothetical protein